MASQFARAAIEIKTPRVLIRTGVPADAEAYTKYATTPANFPYGGCEADMTTEKATQRIAFFAERIAAGRNGWVMMFSRETGAFMGYGGFNTFEVVDDGAAFLAGPAASAAPSQDGSSAADKKVLADTGIMLDHRFWGQGYGLEIFIGLMEWARREIGAALFRTETDLENAEWQALMKRAEVGGCVHREQASYDAGKEVLQWRWDDKMWEEARRKIEAKGRWITIE